MGPLGEKAPLSSGGWSWPRYSSRLGFASALLDWHRRSAARNSLDGIAVLRTVSTAISELLGDKIEVLRARQPVLLGRSQDFFQGSHPAEPLRLRKNLVFFAITSCGRLGDPTLEEQLDLVWQDHFTLAERWCVCDGALQLPAQ